MADSFMRTDPCYEEVLFPGDQCLSARSIRRPSHHARKRGVPVHRLPALSARHGPLDGSRTPAQERGLNRPDHQDLRSPGRALDRQRRQRSGTDASGLAVLLADDKPLDRTTVNSWEDIEFVQAVHATGRRKLVICALWT